MCRSSTTCLQKLSVAQHIGKYGWCWDVHTNVFIITAITVRYIESMQNISAFCENTLIRFAFGLLLHKLLGRISVRRILQKQNRSMLNGWILINAHKVIDLPQPIHHYSTKQRLCRSLFWYWYCWQHRWTLSPTNDYWIHRPDYDPVRQYRI